MGVDKSTIRYHGQTQLHYLHGELCKVCNDVYISIGRDQIIEQGLTALPDQHDIQGPINGILTALNFRPDRAWLCVAIDMPNVNESVLKTLISQRDPGKVATCFYNASENFPEPLLTIWEPKAHLFMQAFITTGNKSPKLFLQKNDVKIIEPSDPTIFLNINYPDEHEKFNRKS
jgi:molybdopterin-guanine dinucleotide biosynthesis protein A